MQLVKTTTEYLADRHFRAVNESGNAVDIDMLPAEEKSHQSPTELLLSALAACASVDLVGILKKRKKTVKNLVVEASGVRRESPPRRFTEIHLKFTLTSPDVELPELEKMGTLAATKFCSVSATLNVEVQHEFILRR